MPEFLLTFRNSIQKCGKYKHIINILNQDFDKNRISLNFNNLETIIKITDSANRELKQLLFDTYDLKKHLM